MPLRLLGRVMLTSAWVRSLPWPGVSTRRNFLCVRFVGSLTERYLSVPACVPTGREHSTDMGDWEVCVAALFPRSIYACFSQCALNMCQKLTRVRRDVLPAPLGPIRTIDGKVVKPVRLKRKIWRRKGIVRIMITTIATDSGDGLKKTAVQSAMGDAIVSM